MAVRELSRSVFRWFRQWWWVLFLIVTVVLATAYAYQLSDGAQPIDAVATAGPLVLSVLLVYLYSRQNVIQEQQQEILESQHEVQQAVEVTPKLHPTWNLQEGGDKLYLKLENNSAADVYNLNLVTEVNLSQGSEFNKWVQTSENVQFSGSGRIFPLTQHFGERETGEFNENLRFNLGQSRSDSSLFERLATRLMDPLPWESSREDAPIEELSFNELSGKVVEEARSDGYSDSILLSIESRLEYEDTTGESHMTPIFSGIVEFEGFASLRKREDSIEAETHRPQLSVENIDIKRAASGNRALSYKDDSIGITVQNVGEELAVISDIHVSCNIIDGGRSISSEQFFEDEGFEFSFTGKEIQSPDLKVGVTDSELLIHPLRFRVQDREGHQSMKLIRLTKLLIEERFRNPVEVRIDVRYCDRVKNSYSLSRTILRFAIGDEHLEQVDDNDFVEIAEPISAAELFRLENM